MRELNTVQKDSQTDSKQLESHNSRLCRTESNQGKVIRVWVLVTEIHGWSLLQIVRTIERKLAIDVQNRVR